MAAIDLYSGIGGWTLGLKMAGIPVLASYEWWKDANRTHGMNFNSKHSEVNIRELKLADLPDKRKIKFVVGSPPCTQFSLSNRGGKGDIADGLIDVFKFLEIVEFLEPKHWAMENVPRVAGILEKELTPNGSLNRFKYLFNDIKVFNSADFGVPQDRKRMIAGNLPFDLLDSYKESTPKLHLRNVITALDKEIIIDPIYDIKLNRNDLTDHILESSLSFEEARINKDSKTAHPVYNAMSFPDRQDRPSRTITALCTRVSRESIIIKDSLGSLRRLTVRERGCVQSFPITYQFFSNSYAGKIKMIGNAVPPLLTFYIAQSMQGKKKNRLLLPSMVPDKIVLSGEKAISNRPDNEGKKYPWNRSFWLAIPGLRFGSGVRFELKNYHNKDKNSTTWAINFFYGNSKNIKQMVLDNKLFNSGFKKLGLQKNQRFMKEFLSYANYIKKIDRDGIQLNWTNVDRKMTGPIKLIDEIGAFGEKLYSLLDNKKSQKLIENFVTDQFQTKNVPGDNKKITANATKIFTGFLIGAYFNGYIAGNTTKIIGSNNKAV
jgi:DNA (cytosine-5)-methyltransferase 1